MTIKAAGDTALGEPIRWDGGATWIAYPEEEMRRASHALAVDRDGGTDVWVVDPVDADGLDDAVADLGTVAGVVVLLDRHTRDGAAIARRHDVPVYLHESMAPLAEDVDADVEYFAERLADTPYRTVSVLDNRFWREIALVDDDAGTLVVPEAVGTAGFFVAGDERLAVHPALRLRPPRAPLGALAPDRILVGHGEPILQDAERALADALAGSRRRAPRAYLGMVRSMLPV